MTTKGHVSQRLRRLEAEILPPPRTILRILHMPELDSGPRTWDDYNARLRGALDAGEKVCVVTAQVPHDSEPLDGVEYVGTEWEAQLKLLANAPSRHGRPSRLHDLFGMLRGEIVKPDPAAAHGEDAEEQEEGPAEVVAQAQIYEPTRQSAGDWRNRFAG